ncbi:hypothetical protein [Paenibacillus alginolyticus]|uniref:hypothetical protein n=1 Tax=Paenibacillus alginolyticus TaxID=59839 RepID=UPI001564384A|nr:hypothetical protein [Paenibacillus frigoriresistens]
MEPYNLADVSGDIAVNHEALRLIFRNCAVHRDASGRDSDHGAYSQQIAARILTKKPPNAVHRRSEVFSASTPLASFQFHPLAITVFFL